MLEIRWQFWQYLLHPQLSASETLPHFKPRHLPCLARGRCVSEISCQIFLALHTPCLDLQKPLRSPSWMEPDKENSSEMPHWAVPLEARSWWQPRPTKSKGPASLAPAELASRAASSLLAPTRASSFEAKRDILATLPLQVPTGPLAPTPEAKTSSFLITGRPAHGACVAFGGLWESCRGTF